MKRIFPRNRRDASRVGSRVRFGTLLVATVSLVAGLSSVLVVSGVASAHDVTGTTIYSGATPACTNSGAKDASGGTIYSSCTETGGSAVTSSTTLTAPATVFDTAVVHNMTTPTTVELTYDLFTSTTAVTNATCPINVPGSAGYYPSGVAGYPDLPTTVPTAQKFVYANPSSSFPYANQVDKDGYNVPYGTSVSPSFTGLAPGNYYIIAYTDWDVPSLIGNVGGTTSQLYSPITCEPFTVSKATPTINTTPNPSSITVGSTFADTATVSGGNAPTGTVTFTVYSDNTCKTSVFTDQETLSNGSALSKSYGPSKAGTYYIQAVYSGDTNNASVTSPCTSEVVTVGQATPTINTTPNPSSITVGSTFADTATVSGGNAPTGTVTFTVYSDNTCKTSVFTDQETLSNGSALSKSYGPSKAGTYYIQAVYSGDTNNASVTSPCTSEVVTVGQATPTINTTPNPSSITVGSTFADTATVSGGNAPTGTVTFTVYSDNTCKTSVFTDQETLSNGSALSKSYGPSKAGTYYIQAVYSGDTNNASVTSPCTSEVVTVGQATPTINTTPNPSSITVGSTFADTATVSGGNAPTGTVTFTVYSDNTCKTSVFTDQETLSNGSALSKSYGPSKAGTYYIQAVYSGDTNNASVTSPCTSEVVTVGQATPTINTTPNPSSITVGSTFADTATVSGGNAPTGTVTFTVYSDNTCKTSVFTDQETLSNGSALSKSYGPSKAGTYYIQAVYSGDTNNASVTSPCTSEVVTVGQATPTINTTPNPSSITVGSTFADTATVSGGNAPTGTVTFTVYSDNTCKTSVFTDQETLSNGSALSKSYGPSKAGTYYIQAVYSGDTNNASVTSPCTSEVVTVGQATPTINTTPNPSSITVGSTFADTATVSGGNAPTGTVTFTVYSDNTCKTSVFTDQETLSNGSALSKSYGPSKAGTYYIQAVYSGDTNNASVTSPCTSEVVTVGQATPTINTTPNPSSITVGSTFADTATVSGGNAPTGTVTFTVYSDNTCKTSVFTDQETLSNGSALSKSYGPSKAGTYYIQAVYSGDTNNASVTSPCTSEVVTVGQATPIVTTQLSSQSVNSGGSFSDSATVSGGISPTGTVTFDVYAASESDNVCSGTPLFTVTVGTIGTAVTTVNSGSFGPLTTGTYYVQATYNGDGNNSAASSPCGSEIVSVSPSTPIVTTQLSSQSVNSGGSFSDSATVSGGISPTGTVTFDVYAASESDNVCSGTPLFTVTVGTIGTAVTTVNSGSFGPLTTGTYYVQATYNGDGNNSAASSPCGSEIVSVSPSTPIVTTQLSSQSVNSGGSFSDSATVSGGISPTGTVTFDVYAASESDNVCSGTPLFTVTVGTIGTAVTTVNSGSFGPLTTGTYYVQAVYNGDGNNSAASSPCGSEIVSVGELTPIVTTQLSSQSVNSGGSFSDSATVSGGISPTGTVTFDVYAASESDNVCSGTPLFTVTVGTIGTAVTTVNSGSFGPLTTGTYYVQATYNGDGNNSAASSPCGSEIVSVSPSTPIVTTQLSSQSVNSGGSFSDSATVSGGISPTGTVTFDVYAASESDNVCSGTPLFTVTVGTIGTAVTTVNSGSFGPLTTGTYYVQATYNGDGNNSAASSPCGSEIVSVSLATPSLSTKPTISGTTATDTVTFTGTPAPSGMVTFTLYEGTYPDVSTVVYSDTETLVDGMVTSSASPSLSAGSYFYLVTYTGDSTYAPIAVGTAPEVVVVTTAPPSGGGGGGGAAPAAVSLSLSTSPTVSGSTATDTATVNGSGATPTGSVTFTLYSGTYPNGTLVSSFAPDTVTLSGNTATSVTTGTLAPGSYYFIATYSGDATYAAITTGTPEPFTIASAAPAGTVTPPSNPVYKIPSAAPQTGAGGTALATFNGGLLALGGLMLAAGLAAMALLFRRRRHA